MNPVAHLRRLSWLPRTLLTVLVLTVAQTSMVPCAMADSGAPMMEHCSYCPPDVSSSDVTLEDKPALPAAGANDCAFPHDPKIDVHAVSAHHVDQLLHSPLLQPATFDLAVLRAAKSFVPTARAIAIPQRPHALTHCVQLK